MYCIITNNEKVIKCARAKGAEIFEVEKCVIVDNEEKFKYMNITPKIVEKFLKKFPRLDMEERGVKYLKYILENKLGLTKDIESIYPIIAKRFGVETNTVSKAITSVYVTCITNIPKCYENFFDNYECTVHWNYTQSLEFVKVCQRYIYENYESLCEKVITPDYIDKFLNEFYCISKKSLGYKCLKYILENKIECTPETKDAVFNELAEKFNKQPSVIARSFTIVYKSIVHCSSVPENFKTFYNQEKSDCLMSLGEHSIELLQILKKYLDEN